MKVGMINFQIANSTPKRVLLPRLGVDAFSFQGSTNKIQEATLLTKPKEAMPQRADGGYLVDNETGTVIYYGDDAKKYLETTNYFPHETQVIAQSDCKLKAQDLNGKKYELSEPGAIVINKGTRADVEVEGNPLVVTCQKKPDWYEYLAPKGDRKEYFDSLVEQNKTIFSSYPKNVQQNGGEVQMGDFEDYLREKLISSEVLKFEDDKLIWSKFYHQDELERELKEKAHLYKEEIDEVLSVWEKTTKSGFDITGLTDYGSSIAVYTHRGKINQFCLCPTEWITNSSQWLPKGASSLGVSRVYNKNPHTRAFNEIRPEERIHKHQNPHNHNEKQVETYILTQGKAAAYLEYEDGDKIKLLHAGDMVVVPAGVRHGIIAASGDYEHLCIQTPSAFQYGFKFKNDPQDFPPEMVEKAKQILDITI